MDVTEHVIKTMVTVTLVTPDGTGINVAPPVVGVREDVTKAQADVTIALQDGMGINVISDVGTIAKHARS